MCSLPGQASNRWGLTKAVVKVYDYICEKYTYTIWLTIIALKMHGLFKPIISEVKGIRAIIGSMNYFFISTPFTKHIWNS